MPDNTYTNLVSIDTVSVDMSTVMIDSFATGGTTSFLLGQCKDPALGLITARPFFQLTIPASLPEIPASAVFDSLSFILRLNNYYYGDTTKPTTIYVNELSRAITYSYNNTLYNTSDVPVMPTPLGSRTVRIAPFGSDSVMIRLNDTKGATLFNMLRDQSAEVSSEESFLNYFRGISLSVAGNDTAVIYGLKGEAGNMVMRVHYHTTIPYPEKHHIDFTSISNDLSFNQLLANRANTGLVSSGMNLSELSASLTNGYAYSQPGTGLYLKMIFPSLRNILTRNGTVRLLRAELIVRPAPLSFDLVKFKLPSQVYLATTDRSNIIGNAVTDTTGMNVQYADPVIDQLYGEQNYYRFNVTGYINQWLNTGGSDGNGFFLLYGSSSPLSINRLYTSTVQHSGQVSKLLLSVIVINN